MFGRADHRVATQRNRGQNAGHIAYEACLLDNTTFEAADIDMGTSNNAFSYWR